MDILTLLISRVNDVLWTYILIIMLLGCAFWFTFKTNFVQFRMIREMIRLLGEILQARQKVANTIFPLFKLLPFP